MGSSIKQAMLLAAGFGTRMRPLTDNLPKPLLPVNGRSMLNRALDKLVTGGVVRAAINTHYLGNKVHEHLANRKDIEITFFDEPEILDTGGGIKNALSFFNDEPFFCINTDLIWTDGAEGSAINQLAASWDDTTMDALMLMVPVETAVGLNGKGDFDLDPSDSSLGRLCNPGWMKDSAKVQRDYFWMAAQVLHPRAYAGIKEKVFSNRVPWEQAWQKGRLWGMVHTGRGFHAGTPSDLELVHQMLVKMEA